MFPLKNLAHKWLTSAVTMNGDCGWLHIILYEYILYRFHWTKWGRIIISDFQRLIASIVQTLVAWYSVCNVMCCAANLWDFLNHGHEHIILWGHNTMRTCLTNPSWDPNHDNIADKDNLTHCGLVMHSDISNAYWRTGSRAPFQYPTRRRSHEVSQPRDW